MLALKGRATKAVALATASLLALTLAACGDSGNGESTQGSTGGETGGAEGISGDITFLTWRTDLYEDGTFDEYIERFNEKYPDISVTIEAITDYEGEVRTRMNTTNYGDVLAIVGTITPDQLPDFFEPLGDVEEMEETYRLLRDKAFEGKAYGIPVVGNTQGIVYNKAVFADAGITETPTTPEEFLTALETIKAHNPDIIPLYTNYADGWPVTQWEAHRGGPSANPNFGNDLTTIDDPWAEGRDHYIIDSLLWEVVERGLTEADPTTTNWELSKNLIGTGQVATMVLGSWAIVQMKDAAVAAGNSADDIGYLPFPSQVDGQFYAPIGGDYNLAINVHSDNKEAARAWIDWYNHESGFAESQQGLSPLKDGPFPDALKDFEELNVQYIENLPAPAGQEALLTDIDNQSEIGMWQPAYRQRLIDGARGASGETKEQIFDDLNQRWAAARATVTG